MLGGVALKEKVLCQAAAVILNMGMQAELLNQASLHPQLEHVQTRSLPQSPQRLPESQGQSQPQATGPALSRSFRKEEIPCPATTPFCLRKCKAEKMRRETE